AAVEQADAVAGVAGDQVPGRGVLLVVDGGAGEDGAADEIGRRPTLQLHAEAVGQRQRAGDVGADVVALDLVVRGIGVVNADPLPEVAGDQVAADVGEVVVGLVLRRDAADEVLGGGTEDVHTLAVGQRQDAGRVRADVVPFDDVVAGEAVEDADAVVSVAGDQVAGGGDGPADGVGDGPAGDGDAAVVGQGDGAG